MNQSLTHVKPMDHVSIARSWVESFEKLEARMLPEIESYLSEDFELMCPGDPSIVPFAGIWKGTAGHQKWLDLFFGFFERIKAKEVKYTSSDHTVVARWEENVTLQGIPCDPVQINLYFHFWDGQLALIFDDYDTQTGSENITSALALQSDPPQ